LTTGLTRTPDPNRPTWWGSDANQSTSIFNLHIKSTFYGLEHLHIHKSAHLHFTVGLFIMSVLM